MPKNLGRIQDAKDITTKEYVDNKDSALDENKLNTKDIFEFTNAEILALWNQYIEE